MLRKKYCAHRYIQRYDRYRRAFAVSCILYLVAFCLGAVLWTRLSLTSFGESLIRSTAQGLLVDNPSSFWRSSLSVLLSRLPALLSLFLLGVTLYAPVVWVGVMLWLGLSGGLGLGFLFRFVSEGMSVWILCVDLLFSFSSALVTSCYASFVLCVYQKQRGRIPDEEHTMFGGTLFCGKFENNGVNLRFFVVYQLVYLCVSFIQFGLAMLYRLLLSTIVG